MALSYSRAKADHSERADWRRRAERRGPSPSLRDALRGKSVAVIAEVKRSSPSKGAINVNLDAAGRARIYEAAGASAISVLTESSRFGGNLSDLTCVAEAVGVPVLRKDFIVADVQLFQARALGASAALLIARALAPEQLADLHDTAAAIGLEILVEVRTECELALALEIGARIVGINNRNLESLEIDPSTVDRVVPRVPQQVVAVAESGMTSAGDVARAAAAGADAVLIGSAISASPDPGLAVDALTRVPVERHARPD